MVPSLVVSLAVVQMRQADQTPIIEITQREGGTLAVDVNGLLAASARKGWEVGRHVTAARWWAALICVASLLACAAFWWAWTSEVKAGVALRVRLAIETARADCGRDIALQWFGVRALRVDREIAACTDRRLEISSSSGGFSAAAPAGAR